MAIGLALRKGEALGLRWTDVDLGRGLLQIEDQSTSVAGRLSVDQPLKTPGSRRELPLPPPIARLLAEHRDRQRRSLGAAWREDGLLFRSGRGGPMHHPLTHPFRRLLAAAGLPELRFHDLRGSCVSILFALGVDLPTIMRLTGHTSAGTTLEVYARTGEAQLRGAAEAIGRALEG